MSVREPAVAGVFYAGGRTALAAQVDACLQASEGAPPHPVPDLAALVVPHAGYVYSGMVAGAAYRLLPSVRERVRRAVLLGPAHFVPLRGLALTTAAAWRTPLGDAAVDAEAGERLAQRARDAGVRHAFDDAAHQPEHSLEVQVPFLQTLLPDVPVLPVLVGDGDAAGVAAALSECWADPATLLVVSTDLSHYEPDYRAREHDRRTAAAICRAEPAAVGELDACGCRPLRALLHLVRGSDAVVHLLDLRTSADSGSSPDRVVGYGAFAVERSGPPS